MNPLLRLLVFLSGVLVGTLSFYLLLCKLGLNPWAACNIALVLAMGALPWD